MDLKTNDGNTKNAIDTEKGALERFESELKNTIFGVFFLLLKDDEISIYTSFIVSIIQVLQILYYPFDPEIGGLWNSYSISHGLKTVLGYLRFVPYFQNTNFNVYVVVFYVIIAFLFFVMIDVFYVSFAYSKKKYAFSWPVSTLRIIVWLFTTILYLPIIDYFFSMLGCVPDGNGNMVHAIFTNEICWQGVYILHAIVAIFAAIIFTVMSLISTLTFFECRSTSNDPTARVNARANTLFMFYQLIIVICFTFMNGVEYQYILLAIIFAGSIILFMKFHFNSPYYNEAVSKLWSALMSINLWTAIMLIFSKIMENTLFEGSIIAWIIGIPFIILIVITNRDHRIDLLLINVNKFQNGEEIQNQIRYILKLISWQATNRNAAILLDGYIEIHKQTCNKDDCPLKQKAVKNNRLTKSLINNDESLNEKYALLIQLLYKMYFHGIKKFPNNTSLRIAYAFFLLDKMHSKQQALQELSQAEQSKPPFDEQFIIYRYKKIIEDEIAESQNEGQGGLDVVSEIAFQNHLRSCQANIEKSALLHMEFWSQLSEDNPDLGKLNEIGSKINSSVQYVEDHWNKLQKINHNNTKAMRLYGKFLIEIINDKEAGEQLLEKARNIQNVATNKKAINMMNTGGDDYTNDATPTVYVSGEQDKFANITGINLAAASLFGYNKTELINRKVNVLMPMIYGKYHDQFLENYLNNGESYLIAKNKERLVFGKNKSNYIFPVHLSLRAVPSILQGIQFIATFRVEKNFKNAAYILTQPDGTIDALSSSCINLLKVDLKMIMQKKANIQDFLPNVVRDRSTIFSSTAANTKSFATVSFNIPRDSEYLLDPHDPTTVSLNCFLYDMLFLGGKENAGFQFRFEKPMDKSIMVSSLNPMDKKAQISNFQFRYERNKPQIFGEYTEGSTSDINSGQDPEYNQEMLGSAIRASDNEADNDMSNMEVSNVKNNPFMAAKQKEAEPAFKRINYAEGIRTLRLQNGRPVEIEEDKDDSENDPDHEGGQDSTVNKSKKEDENQGQRPGDQGEVGVDDYSFRDFNSTFKSRKALNAVINDRKPPPAIRNLRWTANSLMIIIYVLAIVDFVITNSEFNAVLNNLETMTQSDLKNAQLMNVLSKIIYLYTLNIGVTNVEQSELRSDIQTSLEAAQSIANSLESSTSSVSSEHYNLLNNPVIPLRDINGNLDYKGLSQATDQIISRAFQVAKDDLNTISPSNPDYFYVVYNLLNNYWLALRQSSNFYVQYLIDRTTTNSSIFMIMLIVSVVVLFLSMLVLFPVLFNVNKTREEVLSLFLDIPEKTVKSLYQKCENFISNLQVGEDDDVVSEIDDEEFKQNEEEGNIQEYTPKRKKRKFKNSGKSQRQFFIKFLIGGALIEAYFLYNYFVSASQLSDVNSIITEMNATSLAESYYSFVQNAQRQLLLDHTFPINGEANTEGVCTNNIKNMYNLDSLIHQEHSVNIKIHSNQYINEFNNIMMLDPCTILNTEGINYENCETFADGAVSQGMAVALTRYFENIRFMLTLYVRYENGTAWDQGGNVENFVNNEIQNNVLNILTLSEAIEINTMQYSYISDSFRLLMTNFNQGISSEFDTQKTQKLIVFIFYLIGLFALYVIFWIPLISKLSNDIWRTKSMLSMIPLNVISKIKNVRVYLKKFWNARSVDY